MTDTEGKPSALFVCVHNAGRSQMGAGYLTALGGGNIEVHSAGSIPGVAINPSLYRRWPKKASTSPARGRRC